MWNANLSARRNAVASFALRARNRHALSTCASNKKAIRAARPNSRSSARTAVKSLKGGKIRSALRLKEQLFVMNKRYDGNGRVISYSFTGRGWGHGVGMCQYGAYGLGKMGVKYDAILKHYYTGIELTKAY